MPKKIPVKSKPRKHKVKICYYLVAGLTVLSGLVTQQPTKAADCPDVRIIFARGSGAERYDNADYQAFREAIDAKMQTTSLNYEIDDLDYPAIGVGLDNLSVTLGAFFGGGENYEFGASIDAGVKRLKTIFDDASCPDTKYVLGGYSQGAMVIGKAATALTADKLIYLATFGDPKIYLPEGKGIMPAACQGQNLSSYRMSVPDCHAYKGMLGANNPYEPEQFAGKYGTWCNKRDIFCSSYLVIDDHLNYVSENLYEDASRVIFDKITKAFEIENTVTSPHDTAILIDSTGSMSSMINKYKEEAYRLAQETLESGGRVALYDYRDLKDPYEVREHCNFNTCTLETLQAELDKITAQGGGDTPESLLSSSLHVMKALDWKQGSTKSVVVLTDANFLSPDRDGVTFDEVVKLSKQIDPVNFYIITEPEYATAYAKLAADTDGLVVTDLGELSLLTDYIMERYDSLPRVEEEDATSARPELPKIEVNEIGWTDTDTVRVRFSTTNATKTLIVLNDAVLGVVEETEITMTGLDKTVGNTLTLVPLGEELRGEGVNVELNVAENLFDKTEDSTKNADDGHGRYSEILYENLTKTATLIPKAPNAGVVEEEKLKYQ